MADCASCGSCVPWSPTMDCCPDWGDLDDALLCRSIDLAWSTLRNLTAGQVGNCPVVTRPCLAGPCALCDAGAAIHLAHVGSCGHDCWATVCGQRGCSCPRLSEIVLPGQVAEVWQVMVDGCVLDVESYRVDNGNRLVRTDGTSWPSCQDMAADVNRPGTMAVWYVPGIVPDSSALWAAGVLTCEFSKACTGGKCRLPSSVTTIARQGITMEIGAGMFANGLTGIREVDAFILSVNPNTLKVQPMVWSPDLAPAKHRYTTWAARPVAAPPGPG